MTKIDGSDIFAPYIIDFYKYRINTLTFKLVLNKFFQEKMDIWYLSFLFFIRRKISKFYCKGKLKWKMRQKQVDNIKE